MSVNHSSALAQPVLVPMAVAVWAAVTPSGSACHAEKPESVATGQLVVAFVLVGD
jgi:hypothetical protein